MDNRFWDEICTIILPHYRVFDGSSLADIDNFICVTSCFIHNSWCDKFKSCTQPLLWLDIIKLSDNDWKCGRYHYTNNEVIKIISNTKVALVPCNVDRKFDGISSFGYTIPIFVSGIERLNLSAKDMTELYVAAVGGVAMAFLTGNNKLAYMPMISWKYFGDTILPSSSCRFYEIINKSKPVSFYMLFNTQVTDISSDDLLCKIFVCIQNAYSDCYNGAEIKVNKANVTCFLDSKLFLVGKRGFPMWENVSALCDFITAVNVHLSVSLLGELPTTKLVDFSIYQHGVAVPLPVYGKTIQMEANYDIIIHK